MLETRCSSPIPHHTRGRKKTTPVKKTIHETRCSSPIPHHTRGRKKTTPLPMTQVLMNYDMDVSLMIGEGVNRIKDLTALEKMKPLWADVVKDIQNIGDCLRGGGYTPLGDCYDNVPWDAEFVRRDENTGNCAWAVGVAQLESGAWVVDRETPLTVEEEFEYFEGPTKTIRLIEYLKSDILNVEACDPIWGLREGNWRGEGLWMPGLDGRCRDGVSNPLHYHSGQLKNASNFREDTHGNNHHWRCHDDFLAVM